MSGGLGQALLRPGQIDDILCLCLRAQRIAGHVNTVRSGRLILQLPACPDHPHRVKAHVRTHEYPEGGTLWESEQRHQQKRSIHVPI